MKFLIILIAILFLNNCSFDNKTGIWKNEKNPDVTKNDTFKEFESVVFSQDELLKNISIKKDFSFKKFKSSINYDWKDIDYDGTNNLKNFRYNENFNLIFKSTKISRNNISEKFLYKNDKVILVDKKGNIINFSISKNKIISKYNFYKKKYKKVKKKLNIILKDDIVYVSDNLGFLYAYNYKLNKIIWAKRYEVAFRSNIKIYKEKLVTSNQNNNLIFFNIKNGEILKKIPTEETIVKNKFVNNLSLINQYTFFINTFGSLYAVDNESMRILWFINLNKSTDLNPKNLFLGNKIVSYRDKLALSSNEFTYIIDQKTGAVNHKKNFSTEFKPVLIEDYLFAITRNKYLVAINTINGEIIYSYDLNEKIAKFLNTKKKNAIFKDIIILNNKIMILLENSYILIFSLIGDLQQIKKLPTKIKSSMLVIENSLLYFDKKNKLSIVD